MVAAENNLRRNGFVRVHHLDLEQTEASTQPNEVSDALCNSRRQIGGRYLSITVSNRWDWPDHRVY
jgi:hypothetical protein